MSTKDGFTPGHPLPHFLIEHADEADVGKAWDGAVISSRVLKGSILAATASLIAILLVENPVALFANVVPSSLIDMSAVEPGTDQSMPASTADTQALPPTAKDAPSHIPSVRNSARLFADVTPSAVSKSASQPDTDQSTPTIQSTPHAQALPPTAKGASSRDEIVATSQPAAQHQTEKSEPPPEALFRQFEAWAVEKDARSRVGYLQPVQDAPAQVAQNATAPVAENARAPLRPLQKSRHVRPVHHARADTRSVHDPRKKVRREQTARAEVPPPQEARAQDQPMQNLQIPSFLQTFGWQN
jgi:hypothetical protein